MRWLILLCKIIFSFTFLGLFINHIHNFEINYFKYASSSLINKYHFQPLYYYMVFIEVVSIAIPFIKLPRLITNIYKILFITYISFVGCCLYSIYEITNGCIDCHFIAKVQNENYTITLALVIAMLFIYLFIIDSPLKSNKKSSFSN